MSGSSPLARGLPDRGGEERRLCRIIPARAGFTWSPIRVSFRMGDHPRSRGVYARRKKSAMASRGSSPLARGLLAAGSTSILAAGIIPARAGFTRVPRRARLNTTDHPRSRGVYATSRPTNRRRSGSSPLARGLLAWLASRGACAGIIPARAGFTHRRVPALHPPRDHPRSRGVYPEAGARMVPEIGSSPLARGLPPPPPTAESCGWIIPARAGFTSRARQGGSAPPDHPRSRGVYIRQIEIAGVLAGSSPLARGLLREATPRSRGAGIIPARAGFTRPRARRAAGDRDHPRSRGVYVAPAGRRPRRGGSSPLARGLPVASPGVPGLEWIIPARAGFTGEAVGDVGHGADHPRSRGVYASSHARVGSASGSSPLARGLLGVVGSAVGGDGIIPARAGFTPSGSRS